MDQFINIFRCSVESGWPDNNCTELRINLRFVNFISTSEGSPIETLAVQDDENRSIRADINRIPNKIDKKEYRQAIEDLICESNGFLKIMAHPSEIQLKIKDYERLWVNLVNVKQVLVSDKELILFFANGEKAQLRFEQYQMGEYHRIKRMLGDSKLIKN